MGEDDVVHKIMVNECCRSLSFDDEERRFSFALLPGQDKIWLKIRDKVHREAPHFHLTDYNRVLQRLDDAVRQYETIPIGYISDQELLCGEIIEVALSGSKDTLLLVKMGRGQYLDVIQGKGLSLGSEVCFQNGRTIQTSEGNVRGICTDVKIRGPLIEHIALSCRFLGSYYNHPISPSLWELYDDAVNMLEWGKNIDCKRLLSISASLGINAFTMLYILQGVVATWSRHQSMVGR